MEITYENLADYVDGDMEVFVESSEQAVGDSIDALLGADEVVA